MNFVVLWSLVHDPLLFSIYIKLLSIVIDSRPVMYLSFLDDLQFLMSASPDKISKLLHSMQSFISDIRDWPTLTCLN